MSRRYLETVPMRITKGARKGKVVHVFLDSMKWLRLNSRVPYGENHIQPSCYQTYTKPKPRLRAKGTEIHRSMLERV